MELQPITRISWSTHVEARDLWQSDPNFEIRERSDPRVFFNKLVPSYDSAKRKFVKPNVVVIKGQTSHPSVLQKILDGENRAKRILEGIGILLYQLPSHDVKVKPITGEGDLDIQITMKFPEITTSQELLALITKILSDIRKLVQAKHQLATQLTAQGEHGS